MGSIYTEGEGLRRAIKWISEQRLANRRPDMKKLVNDAILRFDLSPKEAEFLIGFYRNADETNTE